MIAVCCHWNDAEAFTKADFARKKILKQWTHTCKAFGVYHLIVIGDMDAIPVLGDVEIKVERFSTYAEVKDKYKNENFVVVASGGEDLKPFRHPKSCIYVFGSNYAGDIKPGKNDKCVGIKTAPLAGYEDKFFPLHDSAAAAIILHDRFR